MNLKIIFLMVFVIIGRTTGQLRCYTCGFSNIDSDHSCLTITESTPTVDCTFQYCTIMRQEYVDPAGVVASFTRGCESEPVYLNHEVTDSTFRTFYRACTNELCNIGNGVQSVVGGNLSPTPEYVGENLLVPGSGGVTLTKINISTLVIAISTIVLNIY